MDMSKYISIFIEESREHLQSLNDKLLILEEENDNRTVLDEVFRSAHTLKGMSATMGYNNMAELTHQMENVLQKVRSAEIKVTSTVIDVIFKCVDQLEKMVDDISSGGDGSFHDSSILQLLNPENIKTQEDNEATKAMEKEAAYPDPEIDGEKVDFNEFESNLIIEGSNNGYFTYHITVYIRTSCVMKSARAYMIFKNLDPIGEIVKTIPSVQDIEDERFESSFEIVLLSVEKADIIRKAIVSIAEIDEPDIAQIQVQGTNREPDVDTINKPAAKQEETIPVEIICDDHKYEMVVPPKKNKPSQTVRVDVERLDFLMNLVGELVINKTQLEQIAKIIRLPEMNEALEHTNRLTSDLQNIVMKVRMVPVDQVFNRFPRMIRDLARDLGKDIDLQIEGQETELDRTVIDEIGDPLVHLLRNAVDHGIEMPEERVKANKPAKATVKLIARHEGNNVIIEVDDDGHGIDPKIIRQKMVEKNILKDEEAAQITDLEVINYIFHSGFSTAKEVTDISGRGVGLDAVRNKIESLSGEIYLDSQVGVSTKFIIKLPLTLAIIQALLVQLCNETYSIPLSLIAETTCITSEEIKMVQDQEVIILRGHVLPLIRLHKVYEVPHNPLNNEEISVVVVKKGEKKVGLLVDSLLGQQEIVIKSFSGILSNIPAIAGATILGNGLVSLIVDVNSLF